MNNGVGDSGSHQIRELQSQQQQQQGKRKIFRRGNDDFAKAIARMSVAQICESVVEESSSRGGGGGEGVRFSSFQESALETLTDVAVRYIENIGKIAHSQANVAGRVESNLLDIVQALEDLGSGLGSVAGVSDTDDDRCCLADSGVVKEIIRYTGEAEEIPFVYALPRFPINKPKRPAHRSFSEVGTEPPDEHIPVWLPAFPEIEGTTEGEVPSKENGSTLSTLPHSFENGRLEILKPPKDVQKPTEGGEVEGNPFLTAPLRFVEKEVSLFRSVEVQKEVVCNNNNHVLDKHNNHHIPVLEASASLDEINKKKNRLVAESEDGEKKKDDTITQRSLVSFKIGTLKRPTRLAINRSFQEQDWFQDSEDKREKKKSEIEETKREGFKSRIFESDVK